MAPPPDARGPFFARAASDTHPGDRHAADTQIQPPRTDSTTPAVLLRNLSHLHNHLKHCRPFLRARFCSSPPTTPHLSQVMRAFHPEQPEQIWSCSLSCAVIPGPAPLGAPFVPDHSLTPPVRAGFRLLAVSAFAWCVSRTSPCPLLVSTP